MTRQFFGYISKETQTTNWKKYVHPYVHCSVVYNSRDVEATQLPNRQVDKKVVVHSSEAFDGTSKGGDRRYQAKAKGPETWQKSHAEDSRKETSTFRNDLGTRGDLVSNIRKM